MMANLLVFWFKLEQLGLTYLHIKTIHTGTGDVLVDFVDLRLGESALHVTVNDAEAQAGPARLRVLELVHQADL